VTSVVVVVGFGCGGSQRLARMANPEPSIEIVDPGAAPRQRLRYDLTLHAPERRELNLKVRATTTFTNTVLETGRRSADFPTMRFVERVEVGAVTPAGAAEVTSEVEEITALDDVVDPAIRKQVEPEVAAMKGLRVSWRMAPSGRIADLAVDAPNASGTARDRISAFADAMRELGVVFPDAEIGVGATWRVTTAQSSRDVKWNRTTTYRLRALTDSNATVEARIVMRAPSQALRVEPNATTRLTSATSEGTAELVVPLRGLVATGTIRSTSEASFSIIRGHLRITSTVQAEVLASVRPLP
jgi:hypothetical protein